MIKYFGIRNICYFFLLFILVGCRNLEKEKTIQLIKDWNGKEIFYPYNLKPFLLRNETSNSVSSKGDYSIVSYTDSSGCIGCKLQLKKWKKFKYEIDSISNANIVINFFMHTINKRELIDILEDNDFLYPVYIDTANLFNKLNHFPIDEKFQTFLLDKDNRVVGIGNPVHNPKVKELYLKIILGDKAPKQKKEIRTTLKMNHSSVDMGSFDWQKEQRTAFTFTNTGTHPLVIVDVSTSCGCTSVEYSKEPIAPGRDVKIKVAYKADHPEHFDKTITVYCNAENSPITLRITGNAK